MKLDVRVAKQIAYLKSLTKRTREEEQMLARLQIQGSVEQEEFTRKTGLRRFNKFSGGTK